MASLVFGFVIGVGTGTWLRDQYEFPTSDRIQQALKLFERDQEVQKKEIEEVVKEAEQRVLGPSTSADQSTS